MEDNTSNEVELKKDNSKSKDSTADKKSKKKKESNEPSFFVKHKAEFRKIKWPNRQELFRETVVVIVISLVVGALIFGIDTVFQFGFGKIINLL